MSTTTTQQEQPALRPLSEIAQEIERTWSTMGKGVNYAARPYLDALKDVTCVTDPYGQETGDDLVRRFLINARTFRGENARRLKAELQAHLDAAPR